jgi:hypothetical protein
MSIVSVAIIACLSGFVGFLCGFVSAGWSLVKVWRKLWDSRERGFQEQHEAVLEKLRGEG